MSLPLVSIGCAVYNGEKTLKRALDGVVGQDYPNLEILIADDGSSDRSIEICEEYARKDPRIKITRNAKNLGVTENCNSLVRRSTGKYFMWADQDDERAPTFVSKTVAALEADPEAVICHSHTGVFIGDRDDIKYIVTLDGVDGVASPVLRYLEFLVYYSDTALYGLIRSEALKATTLYRSDLGASNALLFQLLLKGKFIQVPEVLYFYSGRGMQNRPDVKAEYARANPGKKPPRFYFPFLVLARTQMADIKRSSLGPVQKLELGSVLWGHTSVVALTKLVYRSLAKPFGDLPDPITRFCDNIVEPKGHLVFLNGSERDENVVPTGWSLKGGA